MVIILLLWASLILVVYRITVGTGKIGIGLPLMVLLATTFEYLGAFSYAVPGYSHLRPGGSLYLAAYNFTEETVLSGMTVALGGMVAFTAGIVLATRRPAAIRPAPAAQRFSDQAMITIVTIGLVGFVLTKVKLEIPMIGALQQVGQLTAIAAVAFGLYMAMRGIKGNILTWTLLAAALPAFYLFFLGFMSYGFQVFVVLAVFYLAAIRKRLLPTASFAGYLAVVGYLVLILLVVWLTFRIELRTVLWSDTGFEAKFAAIARAASHVKLLNPFDFGSLDVIVTRINHGMWVGKVIEYHELHPDLYLGGSGLLIALVAWVPRFLWPGKPIAGGSEMLAEHTGYQFGGSATFGPGQVVDLYINLGVPGVICGFFVLGTIAAIVDRAAGRHLRNGDLVTAAQYFVLGLCLTRSLSELFFLVNSIVFTLALFKAVKIVMPQLVAVRRPVAIASRSFAAPSAHRQRGERYGQIATDSRPETSDESRT